MSSGNYPMKSMRGAILRKRTRTKKTDTNPAPDPAQAGHDTISHNVYYVRKNLPDLIGCAQPIPA